MYFCSEMANDSINIRKPVERQSNFELLRIVSMLMVLGVHIDFASLGMPDFSGGPHPVTSRDLWQLTVESICIIGVNCFTMISGWFGIRLKWRGVAAFLFECVFYSVLISTAVMVVKPEARSLTTWVESWLVLSHTDLWYVPAYFGLMLISALLNAGSENLSKDQFGICLSVFVAFNLWCGWWWGGSFNPTGYTLVQLMMIYLIARYLRLHAAHCQIAGSRKPVIIIYVLSLAGIFVSAFHIPEKAFAYNSPFVVLCSVTMFMLFAGLKFRSVFINRLAAGAFSVYLIHKAPPVWGGLIKPTVARMWNLLPLWQFTVFALFLCAAIYLGSWCVDRVRLAVSNRLLHDLR